MCKMLTKSSIKTSPQFLAPILAFHKLINFPTSTSILLEYVAKYAEHVLDQGSSFIIAKLEMIKQFV